MIQLKTWHPVLHLFLAFAVMSSVSCSKKGGAKGSSSSTTTAAANGATGSAIAISAPTNNSWINLNTDSAIYPVSGTCTPINENTTAIKVKVDGNEVATADCSEGAFSATIDTTGLVDGPVQIQVQIPGSGGQNVSNSVTLTKDIQPPSIASVALSGQTSVNSTSSTSYDVTFSDANPGTIDPTTLASAISFSGTNTGDCTKTVTAISPLVARVTITGCSAPTGSAGISIATSGFADSAGNVLVSASSSGTSFQINNNIPSIAITSASGSTWINLASDSATYVISGECTETDQTQLNGESVTLKNGASTLATGLCNSGSFSINIDSTVLSESNHTLTAHVTDRSGNTAVSSALSVNRDITRPLLSAVTGPSVASVSSATSTSYTLTFSDANLGSLSNSSIDSAISITGDSSGCVATTSGTDATSRTVSITGCNGNGSAGISISGTNLFDLAGNSMTVVNGPYGTFTIANAGPSIGITAPAQNGWINFASNSANYSVQGTCSAAGEMVSITIDGGAITGSASCTGALFSGSVDVTGLSPGQHSVMASISQSGLTTTATNSFKVDILEPTVTISSPAVSTVTSSIANSFTLTFADANPTSLVGATLDSAITFNGNGATCTKSVNVTSATTAVVSLTNCTGDGSPTISIGSSAWSDLAGNPLTAATSSSFSVDNAVPTIAITTPTDGSFINGANNSQNFAVSGTCSEAGKSVSLSLNGVSSTLGTCDGTNFSGTINTEALPSGSNTLIASVTDGAGNTGTSATVTVTKMVSSPAVVISSTNTANPTVQSVIPVTVTFSVPVIDFDASDLVVSGGTVSDFAATTGSVYMFSFTPTAASTGTLTISVPSSSATDAGGNSNTASNSYSKIFYTDAPTLNGPSLTNDSTPDLTVGNIIASLNANLYSDSGCSTTIVTAVSSGTSKILTASAISGAVNFYADVTDGAGNKSACTSAFSVTLDTTAPAAASALSWTAGSTSTSASLAVQWSKSGSADLANQKIQVYTGASCSVASGSLVDLNSSTATSTTVTVPGTDTYTFKVMSLDGAGNSSASACSGSMVVTLPPIGLSPGSFSYPLAQDLTVTFTAVGGSGGNVYSIDSGPGSIDSSTGVYTGGGSRTPGSTTVIRVTDSSNASTTVTISHTALVVNGPVNAITQDGNGSVYLGGLFSLANSVPARGFAAVNKTTNALADYGLSTYFNSGAVIDAIAFNATHMFIGGSFTSYRGTAVNNLIKVDLTTKNLDTTFSQSSMVNGAVNALAVDGSYLFVGGAFTNYRSNVKGAYLAKIDTTNGNLETTSFHNTTTNHAPNGIIYALLLDGNGFIYVGGAHTQYRASGSGNSVTKVDKVTGGANPTFGSVTQSGTVYSLALSGSFLYIGGAMTSWRNNTNGKYLAKVSTTNAALETTSFHANVSMAPNDIVNSLAVSADGNSLFVGGAFTSIRNSTVAPYFAKVNIASASGPLDTTTFHTLATDGGPNGAVKSIALDGSDVYLGGTFTTYRNSSSAAGIAKVSAATGVLDTASFHATAMGTDASLNTMAINGSTLYLGGSFVSFKGTPVQNLAKFSISNWSVDTGFTQSTGTNGIVKAVAVTGSAVYVGGNFTTYRGNANGLRLVKLDATTGTMDTAGFNTAASGPNAVVNAILVNSNDLYIAGNFTTYRGNNRGLRLAKLNALTGVLDTTTFNTTASSGPDAEVHAMIFSEDKSKIYIGGAMTTYRSSSYCTYMCAVAPSNGAINTAIFQGSPGGGAVLSIAIKGNSLYIAGNFTAYEGNSKGYRLAKAYWDSGVSKWKFDLNFAPATNSSGPNAAVNSIALSLDGSYLYAGGAFTSYRGSANGYYLAKISTTNGALETTNFNTAANTGPNAAINTFALSGDGAKLYIGGAHSSYRGSTLAPYFSSVSTTNGDLSW